MAQHLGLARVRAEGDGHFAKARQVEHVELSGREVVSGSFGGINKVQRECGDAVSLWMDALNLRRMRQHGVQRGGTRIESMISNAHLKALSRIACTSSVRSIPTGHHVMQRPQPTQPETPN